MYGWNTENQETFDVGQKNSTRLPMLIAMRTIKPAFESPSTGAALSPALLDKLRYANTYSVRVQARPLLEHLLDTKSRHIRFDGGLRIFASDHEDDTSLHNGNLDTSNYSATSTMDHEETPVESWKRWWAWKKISVSKWWRWRKMSVSVSFARSRVSLWYDKVRRSPPLYHLYPDLPEVTLSALIGTGHAESTIPVLKQRSYTGNQPVISSALAGTPCADLDIDGVLEKLNAILGTSYSLRSKILHLLGIPTLHSILKPYVARNDDFGTVYAHLRPYWYHQNVAAIQHELRTHEEWDREMRRKVLVHDRIIRRDVPPRRVWDLYANRVVPYWDRVDVMTPINGYEWPVPMPKDANLDLIRIEMLNLMRDDETTITEYAWLDVLCLRQEGRKNEHLRKDEWKLDVPMIGFVYGTHKPVVCYFNGLGWPLHLTADDFESDRCWFRRAWTLQEITKNPIIGGQTEDDVMEQEVLEFASEMQNRISTKPLDKVAGLVHLLWTEPIPIYDAEQSEADAWDVLTHAMCDQFRAELFFFYPQPGDGRKCWRPSWKQVMMNKFIALDPDLCLHVVYTTEDPDVDWHDGCHIVGDVQGLAEVPKEGKPRQGELVFKDPTRSPHTFKIVADHAYPIPDGTYTLLGSSVYASSHYWVVGQLREDEKFEKLSIFHLADDEQVHSLYMLNTAYRDLLDCGMLRPQAKTSLLDVPLHKNLA
ncbi:hypothetical protein ARMSODRAFT_1024926 [Armillaria solidipes]|uniref:Heterokaryon incompatibility domain-containing protein n=1 Tax=Armillaria solidipes TaxID=1076256 RepID=A0A2H3BCL2_9AGAR|nr:hypothetical protein ARMSODRAFT_1024926 [Armillaria solidipes]